MSEFKRCVRGCVKACGCAECFANAIHDPIPRQADIGLLCRRCGDQLWRWLDEIPDLYATLDSRPGSVERSEGGKRGKISGSPALSRLDVIALTDYRTMPHTGHTNPKNLKYGDDQIETDDGIIDVAFEMVQWSDILADEVGISGRADTLTEAVKMLTTWWTTLLDQPWIDETWLAVRDVRRMLGRAHGEQKPRPVGHCNRPIEIPTSDVRKPEIRLCGNTLYAPESGGTVRCRQCGARYDGMAILRLKIGQEARG